MIKISLKMKSLNNEQKFKKPTKVTKKSQGFAEIFHSPQPNETNSMF